MRKFLISVSFVGAIASAVVGSALGDLVGFKELGSIAGGAVGGYLVAFTVDKTRKI